MSYVRNVFLLCVGMGLFTAGTAEAAKPESLRSASWSDVKQYFTPSVPGLLRAAPGPTNPNQLRVIKEMVSPNVSHVRMQQYYQGFLVMGGYAIVHGKGTANQLLSTDKTVTMNGQVYRDLSTDLGNVPTDLTARAAEALESVKADFPLAHITDSRVEPLVYIDNNQHAHWAYHVYLFIQPDAAVPKKINTIIDAKTFKPYKQWNDIKNATTIVQAKGYGGNSKTKKYLFSGLYPALDVIRDTQTQKCYLENSIVLVQNMKHTWGDTGSRISFNCAGLKPLYWTGAKSDGLDAINGAYSPSNDAAFEGEITRDMYKKWYGQTVLTKNGKPMKLKMRVHFGQQYENAFWDGEQMTFGDGGSMFYPLVSLGVTAHEISHGFTEQHSNLEYDGESGGINESFSDMAAKAAEFYATGKNANWSIGSEIIKPGTGLTALRYMNVPSRDGESIDNAHDYYDGLDVHFSSGVFNRLFYVLATHTGWTTRKAFGVMVEANMNYWTPNTTFQEAGCGVLDAAAAKGYGLQGVRDAMTAVGLDYTVCP